MPKRYRQGAARAPAKTPYIFSKEEKARLCEAYDTGKLVTKAAITYALSVELGFPGAPVGDFNISVLQTWFTNYKARSIKVAPPVNEVLPSNSQHAI